MKKSKYEYEIGRRFIDYKPNGKIARDLTIIGEEIKELEHYSKKTNSIMIRKRKYYKYKCNVCGWTEGEMRDDHIGRKVGCACCRGLTVVKGINDIATTDPDFVQYFENIEDTYKYVNGSNKKVQLKCPDCGKTFLQGIPELFRYGFHCQFCGNKTSYPERFLQQVLDQLNVNYSFQVTKKTLPWCNNYIYDFYLPDLNAIIEVMGKQHYPECEIFYGRTYEMIHQNDLNKQQRAIDNGIKHYICINAFYTEDVYLKKYICEELSQHYDLTSIDWEKCALCANKSILVEICKYWKETGETTRQIGEKFGFTKNTIKNMLKKGTELGLCDYDGKNEIARVTKMRIDYDKAKQVCEYYMKHKFDKTVNQIKKVFGISDTAVYSYLEIGYEKGWCEKRTNRRGKVIEVYKNDEKILTHYGVRDLSRQSKELLGVKISAYDIYKSCAGQKECVEGFVFKYV